MINDIKADHERIEIPMDNPNHNLEEQDIPTLKDEISRIEKKEIEVRQRVFNQSPEYKKREIVFGQIQKINTRLSDIEHKVNEILEILKAGK